MKAMLFAAGIGSRLGELTRSTPKALIEVGGKPMLQHVIERLKAAGVSGIIINLFYLGDVIEEFIKKNNNFDIDIQFSREQELLGTGGGLKQAAYYFKGEDNFYIYNCDIYCDLDLTKVLSQHVSSKSIATLVVMQRESSRALVFDANGQLQGWKGDDGVLGSGGEEFAFSGIHVASPEIFEYMKSEGGNFSIIKPYLSASKDGKSVKAFKMSESYWIDMGKPKALEELRVLLKK